MTTPTLSPTAQALLDAAIAEKDPAIFEVLADYLEERGEPNGWRAVANWMREAFDYRDSSESMYKWPRVGNVTGKVWFWFLFDHQDDYLPNNGIPGDFVTDGDLPIHDFPSVEAALTWLASKFAAAAAFATVRGME